MTFLTIRQTKQLVKKTKGPLKWLRFNQIDHIQWSLWFTIVKLTIFFSHQNSFINFFYLNILQNWLLLMQLLFKFKGFFTKTKTQNLFFFKFICWNLQHSYQSFNTTSMINLALKWHHKNISNNITVFIEFWWPPDMFFGSLDCVTLAILSWARWHHETHI